MDDDFFQRALNLGRQLRSPQFNPYALPGAGGPVGERGVAGRMPAAPDAGKMPALPEESLPQAAPDEPGFLETVGDLLDRPDNAIRSVLTGQAKGLRGLIPFGETLGLYDHRRDHVSGQDVNNTLLGIDKSDDLLSGPGMAGLATELGASIYNFLPGFAGIKGLTKTGRAAAKIGGHLGEVGSIAEKALSAERVAAAARAAEEGVELAKGFKPAPDLLAHPQYGDVLRAGERVPDAEIVAHLAKQPGEVGDAARQVLAENAKRGTEAFAPLENAGERVKAGQEAFLQVGGEYDPLGILRFGGKYNPINWGPKIPGLTAPIHLPQATIAEAPEAAQAVQDVWRGLTNNKVVNPIKNLFSTTAKAGAAGAKVQEISQDVRRGLRGEQGAVAETGAEFNRVGGGLGTGEDAGKMPATPEAGKMPAVPGVDPVVAAEKAMHDELVGMTDKELQDVMHLGGPDEEYSRVAKIILDRRAGENAAKAGFNPLKLGGNAKEIKGPTEIPAGVSPDRVMTEPSRFDKTPLNLEGDAKTITGPTQVPPGPKAFDPLEIPKAKAAGKMPATPEAGKMPAVPGLESAFSDEERAANAAAHEARKVEEISAPVEKSSTLPKELGRAAPRYAYGEKQFQLQFESDIDRASYITAQKSQSKRDADYLAWVMKETGWDEAAVRSHGLEVRAQIKELAKAGDPAEGALRVGKVESSELQRASFKPEQAENWDKLDRPAAAEREYKHVYKPGGPTIDDFGTAKPGNVVSVETRHAIAGVHGGDPERVIGRLEKVENDIARVILPDGRVVEAPADLLKRESSAMKEYRSAQEGFTREQIRRATAAAGDTRQIVMGSTGAPIRNMQASMFAQTKRERLMAELGIEGKGVLEQGQALPKLLEGELAEGRALPGMKSVEFVDATKTNIQAGDRVQIGGDTYQVQTIEGGKARLKGRFEVEYPEGMIPKDKGTSVEALTERERAAFGKTVEKGFKPYEIPKAKVVEDHPNVGGELQAVPQSKPGVAGENVADSMPVRVREPERVPENPNSPVAARASAAAFDPLKAGKMPATPEAGKMPAVPGVGKAIDLPGLPKNVMPARNYEEVRAAIKTAFNASDAEAAAGSAIVQARAEVWAARTGKTAEDYYARTLKGIKARGAGPKTLEGVQATGLHQMYEDGRSLLTGFKGSNIGTFFHEFGHVLMQDLDDVERAAVKKWVGGELTGEGAERFATGFQQYLQTGKAPTPELKGIFERVKEIVSKVYNFIKQGKFKVEVSPEMQATFDNLFGKGHMDEALTRKGSAFNEFEAGKMPATPEAGKMPAVPGKGWTPEAQEQLRGKLEELKGLSKAAMNEHMNKVPGSSEWFQSQRRMNEIGKELRAANERVTHMENEIRKGAANRNVQQYIAEAGPRSEKAVRAGAGMNAGFTPEMSRSVSDILEGAKATNPKAEEVANVLANSYEQNIKVEHAMGIDTNARGSYAPHVGTPAGLKWISKDIGSNPQRELEFLTKLEAKRLGIDPGQVVAGSSPSMMPLFGQRVERNQKAIAAGLPGPSVAVPAWIKGDEKYKQFFMRQLPEVQSFLSSNKFGGMVREYRDTISATHESMIPRLAAFNGLKISEINDVAKSMGAKSLLFYENPAVQWTVRTLRHIKSVAGANFFERVSKQLGKEVEARTIGQAGDGIVAGVTKEGEKVWGVEELNKIRGEGAGGRDPVWFNDPETAKAVRQTWQTFEDPAKLPKLVQWYDNITQLYKSYLTRAFPAFHIRNHVGNQLQSWLGGVPLEAREGEVAAQVLAGKDVKYSTPMGELNSNQIRKLADENGVTRGGFFDDELREKLGFEKEPETWNPLKPNNKFVKGAERVSAGIATAPRNVMAGVAGASTNATGSMLEQQDRLRHFLYKLGQGEAPGAAAASVDKYLFDYSKNGMAPIEKEGLSRAVFFYGYTRNVIPMMASALVTSLDKVAAMSRLGIQPGKPDREPSFTKTALSVPRGSDEKGNRQLMYGLGTPLEGAAEPLSHNPLDLLNPILKAPLEYATGKDFFLDKNIEDTDKAPHWAKYLPGALQEATGTHTAPTKNGEKTTWNPWIGWGLRESPLSRVSNTASRLTDEQKDFWDKGLNTFTGSRTVSVDEDEEEKYAQKDAIKAELKKLEKEGRAKEFKVYGAGTDERGKKDARAVQLLKALRSK